jgi:hypothetical protein
MSSFQQFSFGKNDENVGKRGNRFKGEGGRRYRVSVAWWQGVEDGDLDLTADGPEFTGAQRNYIPGVGYIINKGPEYTKLAGDTPRMAIGTILVVWPTNAKGVLDKSAIAKGEFEVQPWIFGQDKYKDLEPIHREFHFGAHDVTINCTETQYQRMSFSPCKDSLLAKLKEKGGKLWTSIVEQVQAVAATIQDEIGRDLDLDTIRAKMNGDGGGGNSGGQATQAVATEDLDSLVENLLDDD